MCVEQFLAVENGKFSEANIFQTYLFVMIHTYQ